MKKLNYLIQCRIYDNDKAKVVKQSKKGYVVDEHTVVCKDEDCSMYYRFTDLKTGLLLKMIRGKSYKEAIELFVSDIPFQEKLKEHRAKDYYAKQINDFDLLTEWRG